VFEDHAVERRHADHGSRPENLNGVEGGIQVDAGLDDQGASHEQCGQAAGLAEDMEERGIAHDDVVLRRKQRLAHADLLVGGDQEKGMRNGHPLGKLGRSPRAEDLGGVPATVCSFGGKSGELTSGCGRRGCCSSTVGFYPSAPRRKR
jgi:hypothetical protein